MNAVVASGFGGQVDPLTVRLDGLRLVPAGSIEARTAATLRAAVDDLIGRGVAVHQHVVVDLDQAELRDGTGVAILLHAASRARRLGINLAVSGNAGASERVLRRAGVSRV